MLNPPIGHLSTQSLFLYFKAREHRDACFQDVRGTERRVLAWKGCGRKHLYIVWKNILANRKALRLAGCSGLIILVFRG